MLPLEHLELKDVSITCKPSIMNFSSWEDSLKHFSFTFTSSHVYAIVSESGSGGWALSYLLSGKSKAYTGKIFKDGNLIRYHWLQENGWYVGEGLPQKRILRPWKELTICQQLESGVTSAFSVSELMEAFELTPDRMDREMKYSSNERWNASCAIGIAHGKLIFCFPWLEDSVKNIIRMRLRHCSEILKQNNCIVIIPVESDSIVKDFVDEIIYI